MSLLFSTPAKSAATGAPPPVEEVLVAISSGHDNNCGLNSLIHLWMALPDELFADLYQNFPIFQEIHREFCQTYGGGEPTLEKLMKFKKLALIDNPWDRELIWGNVFRAVLLRLAQADVQRSQSRAPDINYPIELAQYEFDESEMKYLFHGQCIDWKLLRLLTQEMGLHLTVYNQAAQIAGYQSPTFEYESLIQEFAPKCAKALWQADLFFNGNHYNFTYPDKSINAKHNQQREEKYSKIQQTAQKMLNSDATYLNLRENAMAIFKDKPKDYSPNAEEMEVYLQYHRYEAKILNLVTSAFVKNLLPKIAVDFVAKAKPQ